MVILDRRKPQIEILGGILVWLEMAKAGEAEEAVGEAEEAVEEVEETAIAYQTQPVVSLKMKITSVWMLVETKMVRKTDWMNV